MITAAEETPHSQSNDVTHVKRHYSVEGKFYSVGRDSSKCLEPCKRWFVIYI